jgi:hypothetical protein
MDREKDEPQLLCSCKGCWGCNNGAITFEARRGCSVEKEVEGMCRSCWNVHHPRVGVYVR